MENENIKIKEKELISIIFHRKTDRDLFKYDIPEIEEFESEQLVAKSKLSTFINSNIKGGDREELNSLIDEYVESTKDVCFWEGKCLYSEGFSDSFNLFLQHLVTMK